MSTHLQISGRSLLINGQPVYAELPGSRPEIHGLLFNQRMIQGVFDDQRDRSRFSQSADGLFDPETHTDHLIEALPQWYAYGLRAISVGFQGGWPVGSVDVRDIDNNPFGSDGTRLDPAYAARMDRIIRAADRLGMVVIVSLLYWAQAARLRDNQAIRSAVETGSRFVRDGGYRNVILEIANEYNIDSFRCQPLVFEPEGMVELIHLAQTASGGCPVGASGGGGMADQKVAEASDIVLIHGNGLTAGQYYHFIRKVRQWVPDRPIVCNEDSPCCTRVDVAALTGTSWGYYNNYTKQIPPADFSVTAGEDLFFARRMAAAIGIPVEPLPESEQYVLQGLEPHAVFNGHRAIRLAAERPETIRRVRFELDGQLIDVSHDEPFFCLTETTWLATPWKTDGKPHHWRAIVELADGRSLIRESDCL